MNRKITNIIRFLMDECLPRVIRDNHYFMFIFFKIWFKGIPTTEIMNFKKNIYKMNIEEYDSLYARTHMVFKGRETDLNSKCIETIINLTNDKNGNLLDVGCGRGYLLNKIWEKNKNIELYGVDVFDKELIDIEIPFNYFKGHVESLPFESNNFDVVLCTHTLEHIINIEKAIDELIRVTKDLLVIVVPAQHYFYYTLDLHVNFYPFEYMISKYFTNYNHKITKLDGDWLIQVYPEQAV